MIGVDDQVGEAMGILQTVQRKLRALWRCERGVELIEFAAVCPVLLAFVLGSLEISAALYAQVDVEGALRQAARFGKTGQISATGLTREAQIRGILACYVNGRIDLTKATLTINQYPGFADIPPEPYIYEDFIVDDVVKEHPVKAKS